MDKYDAKMKGDGLSEAAIAAFRHNYEQLVAGNDGIVPESSIEAIEVCITFRFQLHSGLCS
jgi:UTP--glucose-1-phosphate uridylyltransferase